MSSAPGGLAYVVELPTEFSAWELANWIERTMLIERLDQLDRVSIVARFGSDQPDPADLDAALSELRRRSELPGTCYPLVIDAGVVSWSSERSPRVYEFLTLISLSPAPFRTQSRYNEVSPIFDLLVRESMRARLGDGAEAYRFGTPVRDGRPENFADALVWLAAKLGRPEPTTDSVRSTDNDAGVDVVAWKPFATGMTLSNLWLVQCTVQVDFKRKGADMVPGQWLQLLNLGTPPSTALAVPFLVAPRDSSLRDVDFRSDEFLSRLEICELVDAASIEDLVEWQDIEAFIDAERSHLTAGPAPSTAGKRRKKTP